MAKNQPGGLRRVPTPATSSVRSEELAGFALAMFHGYKIVMAACASHKFSLSLARWIFVQTRHGV